MATSLCIFCRKRANSQEHVWPDWILRSLRPGERRIDLRLNKVKPLTSWSHEAAKFVTRSVCKKCNETWMSDIEGNTQAIIRKLAKGSKCTIGRADADRLALWATKTAMVVDSARPANHRFFDTAACEYLRIHLSPPPFVAVFVGYVLPNEYTLFGYGGEKTYPTDNKNVSVVVGRFTITVAHLGLQCAGMRIETKYDSTVRIGGHIHIDGDPSVRLLRPSPARWRAISWPVLPAFLDDAKIKKMRSLAASD